MKLLKYLGFVFLGLLIFYTLIWLLFWLALSWDTTDWSGPIEQVGPLPATNVNQPIRRLVDTRNAMSVGKQKRLYWDEGQGMKLANERIQPLLNSIPKELRDKVSKTRDVPAKLYAPFRDDGTTTYEYLHDSWGIVVSLNPDVLIVSVYERPVGPHDRLPREWSSKDEAKRLQLTKRLEELGSPNHVRCYAGTLAPWSEEMHLISSDPAIAYRRLQFDKGETTVHLPQGKLVLKRQGSDVEVTRE